MQKEDLCTVLVNSCDAYNDAWEPFFKLFKKYWPDCKFPIALNTETKKYSYMDLNIKAYNTKLNIPWSKRLKSVLKRINSKYIIFLLEDFFLMDFVDSKRIDEVIEWMEKDPSVAVFSFFRVEDDKHKDTKSTKYPHYYLRNKYGDYRYNCQAAVWNRKELIKTLRNFESAWDWELDGNYRSYRSKKQFYTLMDPKYYIFKYDCEVYGLFGGKWRMPGTEELFKKENINMDLDIRNKKKKIKKEYKNILVRKFNSAKYYLNKLRSKI